MPAMHISYYSLEQQASFQYRGLQFWRRYIEPQQTATNTHFRFDTSNFFDYCDRPKKLPESFFDFIVISHCFVFEENPRINSYKVFRQMFFDSLKATGFVILIIQGRNLFKAYNAYQSEDSNQEKNLVIRFVEDLGLKLEWYNYISSTGKRTSNRDEFGRFARDNLPVQIYMSKLKRQYLDYKYDSHYALDDYVIVAKK